MKNQTLSMKLLPSTVAAFALYAATAQAQETPPPAPPSVEPAETPSLDTSPVTPPAPTDSNLVNTPTLPGETSEEELPPAEQEELVDGMRLNNAALNTVFEVLARDAGLSYFHNNRIASEDFNVNGYLKDGNPLTQMEDLAFNNALTLHRKGNTIYALTSDQLNQLPATEWTYQMRYLKSENMKEHIRELVSPLLSPNTGIVNYEPKTNTLIVIDTPYKIQRVQNLLERIDKAKGQVVVEVQIYRVNNSAAQELGFDWSTQLSKNGSGLLKPSAALQIGSLLGLPGAPRTGGDLVFNNTEITAAITALNSGGITKLLNKPVLITEDNEPANITVIERVPIVTYSTSGGGAATENPTVEVEVRYKIDEEDSTDPETTREIGTTIAVTPTLLPDGTIRLKMRPRTASITGGVEVTVGENTSLYPEVLESSLTTIARVPDSHSLVIGGFFQEETKENDSKVPLLGDLPGIGFFFKNKNSEKEKSSLIFVVTPSSYNPASHSAHHRTNSRLNKEVSMKERSTTYDLKGNDDLMRSNIHRTIRNIKDEPTIKPLLKGFKSSSSKNKRYRVHR